MRAQQHPDVIVIGAGVVGLFTAWELADAGLKVLIIDRAVPGREASWAGGGILSPLHPWQYPEAVLALSRLSQATYPDIARQLTDRTGIDPEYTQNGLLILEPASVVAAKAWSRQASVAIEALFEPEIRQRYPGITPAEQAVLLPSVAQIRNPRLLKALIALLQKMGVEFLEGTSVECITNERERVCGVRLAQGSLSAGRVVVSAGAWSADIVPFELSVHPVKGQMLLYSSLATPLSVMALRDDIYLIPRRDGRILVGSSVENLGYDKTPTEAIKQRLAEKAQEIFPALAESRLEAHWAGLRPGSPDGIPFICECPGIEGLYLNTGHFRHGLLTAPASARLLTDLVLKRQALVDPGSYRWNPGREGCGEFRHPGPVAPRT